MELPLFTHECEVAFIAVVQWVVLAFKYCDIFLKSPVFYPQTICLIAIRKSNACILLFNLGITWGILLTFVIWKHVWSQKLFGKNNKGAWVINLNNKFEKFYGGRGLFYCIPTNAQWDWGVGNLEGILNALSFLFGMFLKSLFNDDDWFGGASVASNIYQVSLMCIFFSPLTLCCASNLFWS